MCRIKKKKLAVWIIHVSMHHLHRRVAASLAANAAKPERIEPTTAEGLALNERESGAYQIRMLKHRIILVHLRYRRVKGTHAKPSYS
jgi:hypothetical protein